MYARGARGIDGGGRTRSIARNVPLGWMSEADEIAKVVLYLQGLAKMGQVSAELQSVAAAL